MVVYVPGVSFINMLAKEVGQYSKVHNILGGLYPALHLLKLSPQAS